MSSNNSDFWSETAGICTIVGLVVGTILTVLTLYLTWRQFKLLRGHTDLKTVNNNVERKKQSKWKSRYTSLVLVVGVVGVVIPLTGTVVLAANISRIQALQSSTSQTTSLPTSTGVFESPTSTPYSSTPTVSTTLSASAASAPPNFPTEYRYIGCYKDFTDARILNASNTSAGSMTIRGCAEYCGNYPYFGTEYATQCYCGKDPPHSFHAEDRFCNSSCAGNASERCGGTYYLSVGKLA